MIGETQVSVETFHILQDATSWVQTPKLHVEWTATRINATNSCRAKSLGAVLPLEESSCVSLAVVQLC